LVRDTCRGGVLSRSISKLCRCGFFVPFGPLVWGHSGLPGFLSPYLPLALFSFSPCPAIGPASNVLLSKPPPPLMLKKSPSLDTNCYYRTRLQCFRSLIPFKLQDFLDSQRAPSPPVSRVLTLPPPPQFLFRLPPILAYGNSNGLHR